MRKSLFILLVAFSMSASGQVANRLNPAWAYIDTVNEYDHFMVVDFNSPQLVFKNVRFDSTKINYFSVEHWFPDSLGTYAAPRFYPRSSNPAGYLTSVSWADIAGKPTFATVATTGDYDDLLNKPTLFSGSYNDLSNKPTLFSGDYADLTGKPTLFDGDYNSLTNKPTLFDGDYNNLTNKPTIPTNTNQLTNGANFITSEDAPVQSVNGQTGDVNLTLGDSVEFYNSSGRVHQKIKVFTQSYTPNTGNGYSMDISAAGFSTILSVQVSPGLNTSSSGAIQDYEIKSVSTSAVTVNITTPNALNVSLVGLTLLGVPNFIGSGTGTTIYLTVIGY